MPLDLKDLDREVEDMRKKVEKIKRAEVEELKEELGAEGEGKDRYIT
jgi:hypothetical protein